MPSKRKPRRKFNRCNSEIELRKRTEEYFIELKIDEEEIDGFDPDDFIEGYYDPFDPSEDELDRIYDADAETDDYRFKHHLGEYEGWSDFYERWDSYFYY